MTFDKLKQFRSRVYTLLGNAKDALFDLMDAVLVTLVFTRSWNSPYLQYFDGSGLVYTKR